MRKATIAAGIFFFAVFVFLAICEIRFEIVYVAEYGLNFNNVRYNCIVKVIETSFPYLAVSVILFGISGLLSRFEKLQQEVKIGKMRSKKYRDV